MCIGMPMTVCAVEPGHAWVEGRGQRRRVNTALVGEPVVGEWLLIFLEGARERLSPERAAEVNAALDLIEGAMGLGNATFDPLSDPGFMLPSAMSAAEVARLAGHGAAAPTVENPSTGSATEPTPHPDGVPHD